MNFSNGFFCLGALIGLFVLDFEEELVAVVVLEYFLDYLNNSISDKSIQQYDNSTLRGFLDSYHSFISKIQILHLFQNEN